MSALINRQFWIISLRSAIHAVVSRCTVCVRSNASNPQPVMVDLPATRVQQCRVFVHVGIDYAGSLPLHEHQLRKSRVCKVYVAMFICLSVKAVHLEVVTDLSTKDFFAKFGRFVVRHGLPIKVFSDCETNFVGTAKQLWQLVNSSAAQQLISATSPSCNQHFDQPGASHFGGLQEAVVRSAK